MIDKNILKQTEREKGDGEKEEREKVTKKIDRDTNR